MKRLLSMLLLIAMLFGMLPMAAQAEGITPPDEAISAVDDTAAVVGSDSLGNMLADAIEEEQEEVKDSFYSISGLEITGSTATVTYDALEEATVLVAIYSEDSMQLLCSGKTTISPDETTATVTIEGDMPQYFEATAYMLDTYDMSPLCAEFSTSMYTEAIQDLLNSTVNDYDADRVLSLDGSEDTNFVVYKEEVVAVDGSETVNTVESVDYDNEIYVIGNIDEQITGLLPGNIFVYPYEPGSLLVVKVENITIDGTTATITGTEIALEDAFDYMKLETASTGMEYDGTDCDEGITYNGVVEQRQTRAWEDEVEVGKSFSFSVSNSWDTSGNTSVGASVSGSVNLGITANLYFYIALKKQVVEMSLTTSIKYAVSLTGTLKIQTGMNLGKITLPSHMAGVKFICYPDVIWQFDMTAEVSGSITRVIGFRFESFSGFKDISKKPKTSYDASVDGTLFVGVEIETGIGIPNTNVLELGFTARVGVEISSEMTGTEHESIAEDAYKKHTCKECLSVDIDLVAEFSVWLKMLKYIKAEKKFLTVRVPLGEWYWSLVSDHPSSGPGPCPYYDYRVIVQVKGADKKVVPNQPVYLSDGTHLGNTAERGNLPVYLPEGKYTFVTTLGGEQIKSDREIDNSTKVVLTNNKQLQEQLEKYLKLLIQSLSVKGEDVIDSGSFSSGVSWKLYRSGKFIVQGNGAMDSYSAASKTPWYKNRAKIKAVELKDGVTNVGNYAFADCVNLHTLIIPNSATSTLGSYAFSGCTGLKSVRLPVDYTANTGAFSGCTAIENIQFTVGATGVMKSASSDSKYIGYAARSSVKSVIFDEGVTAIGSSAFSSAKLLQDLYLPDSLRSIGSYAFSYCTGLQELVVSDAVSSLGYRAFEGCTGLKTVTLPVDYAIGCSYSEYYSGGSTTYEYHSVFFGCTNVETIYYTPGATGKQLDRTLSNAISSSFNSRYYVGTLEYQSRASLKQVYFAEGISYIGEYAFRYVNALEYADLPSTLTEIGYSAFRECTSLNSIDLPVNLKFIDDYAFEKCTALTGIQFPESLTTIGIRAFSQCTRLSGIGFSNNINYIGSYAFYGCTALQELVIPDNLGSAMSTNTFRDCTGLKTVTLPVDYKIGCSYSEYYSGGSTTYKYHSVFFGCTNVETIYYTPGATGKQLDRTVSSALSSSFDDCYYVGSLEYQSRASLKQVYFAEGISYIGEYAFRYVNALEYADLPSTLTEIGYSAFRECTSLNSIDLPVNLKFIDDYAFEKCTALTGIQFPESLTTIGSRAFSQCTRLSGIGFSNNINYIGSYAFYGCTALQELIIPDNLGSAMSTNTFRDCTGLKTVTIPVDYQIKYYYDADYKTGSSVFYGCTNVATIYYTSGKTGIMQNRNTNSSNSNYYGGSLEYQSSNSLKQVYFGEGVTRVGNYAYYPDSTLEVVDFPSTLRAIGSYVFYDCTSLRRIDLPEGLKTIGHSAFFNCTRLEGIQFPESLTYIDRYAFYNCVGLTKVTSKGNLSYIGSYAFSGCIALQELVIPNASVSSLSLNSFGGCTGLKTVTLPADYNVMYSYTSSSSYECAFYGCTNVETIYYTKGSTGKMPDRSNNSSDSNRYLGSLEYQSRNSLKQVYFNEEITYLGSYAFCYANALESVTFAGNAPTFAPNAFSGTTATIYYHAGDATWTAEVMQNYGGSLTWKMIEQECPHISTTTTSSATCTKDGLLTLSCATCGAVLSVEFQSAGHVKIVDTPTTEATCWRRGSVGGTHCAKCYATITEPEVIPPIEHNYVDGRCSGCDVRLQIPSVSGACDNNLTWTLNSDGLLTISGSGDLLRENDWYYAYGDLVRSVVIEDGVTALEEGSFDVCSNMTSVTIGSGLSYIGEHAFSGCIRLTSIIFEGSTPPTIDGSSAFCDVIATVYYPKSDLWTDDILQDYDGTLTWVAYEPAVSADVTAEVSAPSTEQELLAAAAAGQEAASALRAPRSAGITQRPVRSVYEGQTNSSETDKGAVLTSTFTDLTPGANYAMFALVSAEAEDLLAAENLLAVHQGIADENGTLVFTYTQRVQTDVFCVFAAGPSNKSLSDAQITFAPMYADGSVQVVEPIVTYNGITLTEELDYVTVGQTDFTKPGTYTCQLRGIRSYTGVVECTYTVLDPSLPENVKLTSASVVLDSVLAVRFYTPSQGYTVTARIGDGEAVELTASSVSAIQGCCEYSIDVFAQDMMKPVTAQILDTDGNVLDEAVFNLPDYIASIQQMDKEDASDEVKKLALAALNYCQYAAKLKGNDAGALGQLEDIPQSAFDEFTIDAQGAPAGTKIFTYLENACQLGMRLPEGAYTVTINGVLIAPDENGAYLSEEILPQDYDAAYTFTIMNDDQVIYSAAFSVMAYIGQCMKYNVGTADQQNLLKAMYHYYAAADAYNAKNT